MYTFSYTCKEMYTRPTYLHEQATTKKNVLNPKKINKKNSIMSLLKILNNHALQDITLLNMVTNALHDTFNEASKQLCSLFSKNG
jgi:hypothetical protein